MPPERIRIRVDVTSDEAVDFVHKLAAAEDDPEGRRLRERLESSPAEALWEYGIEASPELLDNVTLPTREEMQKLLKTIAAGEPVTITASPQVLFPIFCMMFPHIGLGARQE